MHGTFKPAANLVALGRSRAASLRRWRVFPLFSLTARIGLSQRLHRMVSRRAAEEIVTRKLDRLLALRDPRAAPQDPADLLFLHDTVSRRRPKRCIEFGSGQTTVFIAEALYRQNHGHLWSLDANKDWLEHSRQMLPGHLQPFVTFLHSPVELTDEHGAVAWRHGLVPQGPWDSS